MSLLKNLPPGCSAPLSEVATLLAEAAIYPIHMMSWFDGEEVAGKVRQASLLLMRLHTDLTCYGAIRQSHTVQGALDALNRTAQLLEKYTLLAPLKT